MKKRVLAFVVTLALTLSLVPGTAFAAGVVASGYCGGEGDGKNLTWTLYDDGLLTIDGIGKMKDYGPNSNISPWRFCGIKAIEFGNNVSSIGSFAFRASLASTNMTIPDNIVSVGEGAFADCSRLTSITFSAGVKFLGENLFSSCTSLTDIYVAEDNPFFSNDSFGVLYDKQKKTLVQYPVGKILNDYEIPNGVINIGNSAFSCATLTNVTIPNSVTSIGKYAFNYCTNLSGISIPSSVTSIGAGAFIHCTNLSSINIPDSVKTIGSSAFASCARFTSITIPDSVTFLGSGAFDNCTGLADISIGNGITSIGNTTFYNTRIIGINIPESVTSIGKQAFERTPLTSVIIPDNVTSIDGSAFQHCSHLSTITIGNGVTSIGNYAFRGCTGLTDVYYNGTKAQWGKIRIGDSNACLTNATIHFMRTDLPPTTSYQHNLTGGSTTSKVCVYEYNTLKELSDAAVSLSNKTLTITLNGYEPVSVPNCTINLKSYTHLTLVPKSKNSFLSAVHCKGKDALVNDVSAISTDGALDIYAYSSLPAGEISAFRLLQDSTVIATSTDGHFSIAPSKVTAGKKFSVCVVKKDGTVCPKIKTNIQVKNAFDQKFSLGNKVKFEIPGDVPLLGGKKTELDFSFIPVVLEQKNDVVRIGIGCKTDLLKNETDFGNWKKWIEKQDRKLEKGLNAYYATAFGNGVTAGLDKKFDLKVYGYFEGTLSPDGGFRKTGGAVMIKITGSVENEWQSAVWVIPVVVKFKAEAGLESIISLGLDLEQAKLYADGTLDLTLPEITLSSGVGIAYVADISVYGKVANKIKISTKASSITATLSGELGLSAKALFWSDEWPILKDDWQYYYNGNASLLSLEEPSDLLDAANFRFNRDYAETQSGWRGDAGVSLMGASSPIQTDVLQESVYFSADPQLVVTDSGKKVLFWTGDLPSRTDGNHTAILYSVYDVGSWSAPKVIDEDGTADFKVSAVSKGETVYLAWMDSKRDNFTATTSMADMAAACEITAAVYDGAADTFTTRTLTDNGVLDASPVVGVAGNTPYVVWVSNEENDLLSMGGQNTVWLSAFDGDWSTPARYAEADRPILDTAVGGLNGTAAVAYTVDRDGDPQTTDDISLYVGSVNDTPKEIDVGTLDTPCFGSLNGGEVLAWYDNGGVGCLSSLSGEVARLIGATVNPQFALTEDGVLSVLPDEDGSALYLFPVREGVLGEPSPISDCGAYIGTFSAAKDGDALALAFLKNTATITEDTLTESTDLCVSTVRAFHDVVLTEVYADPAAVTSGGTLPVTLTVKNNGTSAETKLTVTAKLKGSTKLNTTVDFDLPAGETRELNVNLPLESTITPESLYTFTVMSSAGTDRTEGDNAADLTIGYADLRLSADMVKSGSARAVLLEVENQSVIPTNAVLYAYENNAEGKLLGTYDIGTIAGNGSEFYELDSTTLPALNETDKTCYFMVEAEQPEEFISDNSGFVYLDTPERELQVQVSVDGTEFVFPSEVTGKCTVRAALYDNKGRMLDSGFCDRQAKDATASLTLNSKTGESPAKVKVFFMDEQNRPLAEALTKSVS